MALTRPFAYNTGGTITDMNQVGDLAVGPTYNNEWRYDLQYGGATWYMGADEELGYIIGRNNVGKYRPRFKRSDFTEQGYLDMVNDLSDDVGGPGPFTDTLTAKNWVNTEEFWQTYTGGTGPSPTPSTSLTPTPTPTIAVTPTITPSATCTRPGGMTVVTLTYADSFHGNFTGSLSIISTLSSSKKSIISLLFFIYI